MTSVLGLELAVGIVLNTCTAGMHTVHPPFSNQTCICNFTARRISESLKALFFTITTAHHVISVAVLIKLR